MGALEILSVAATMDASLNRTRVTEVLAETTDQAALAGVIDASLPI